jgi:hypothetical protein
VIDKASPAGWVVQIMTPGHAGALPGFRYFNVAIADAKIAVEATAKQVTPEGEAHVPPYRPLSAQEIAVLRLKTGAVKPA